MNSAHDRFQSARSSGDARGMERSYRDMSHAEGELMVEGISKVANVAKKRLE